MYLRCRTSLNLKVWPEPSLVEYGSAEFFVAVFLHKAEARKLDHHYPYDLRVKQTALIPTLKTNHPRTSRTEPLKEVLLILPSPIVNSNPKPL